MDDFDLIVSELFNNKYNTDSTRLKNWDYSSPGFYYVTIVTDIRINYFGKIEGDSVILNEIGNIVLKYWNEIPEHFSNVKLDEFIIMPNHIHGIIKITNDDVETSHCNVSQNRENTNNYIVKQNRENTNDYIVKQKRENTNDINITDNRIKTKKIIYPIKEETLRCDVSTGNDFHSKIPPKPKSISAIMRSFKSVCTKMINIEDKELKFGWQPRFYDRIIRNENELRNVQDYIKNNVSKHNNDFQ
jgi:putative transposase